MLQKDICATLVYVSILVPIDWLINFIQTGIRPGGSFSLHKPDRPKSLSLPTGWRTMTDDISGRPYYFNSKTGERSWKPPRNSYSKAPPSSPEASTASCSRQIWMPKNTKASGK